MLKKIIRNLYQDYRNLIYNLYTTNKHIEGKCKKFQPVVMRGNGLIKFGENVRFGVFNSPRFLDSYTYLEARGVNSKLEFGDYVSVNNGFSAVAEKRITIGNNVLIGVNCVINDSNFHDLKIENRLSTDPDPQEVVIGDNVFIASNVQILKGVNIGANSVVGAGAIVTSSFPNNVVIAGVPAKVIREL